MAEVADQDEDAAVMNALVKRLADAERLRRVLIKMKHKFEMECMIPKTIPFKKYEQVECVERPKRSFNLLAKTNVRVRSYLCLLLGGIRCIRADKDQLRYELRFCTGPCQEAGYEVHINYVENEGFRLIKYNLPHGLQVREIEESFRPMKERTDLHQFLRLLHNSGCAMLHRKKELENFIKYCSEKGIIAETFSSSSGRYMEIKLWSDTLRLASKKEFVTFFLEYGINTILPKGVTFEKELINKKDRYYLDSHVQDFLTLKLVEALRCIRHVKHPPGEDSLEESKEASENDVHNKNTKEQQKVSVNEMPFPKRVPSAKSNLEQKNAASQKISEPKTIESKHKNVFPKHTSVSVRNVSQMKDVSTRSKDISPKSTPTHPQKMSGKNSVESTPKLVTHKHRQASSKTKGPKQKLIIFQKSSTPLKKHSTVEYQEHLLENDSEIDDLSSITTSDKVQNPLQAQSENPVAASTPFQQPFTRTPINKQVKGSLQNNSGKSSRFSREHSRQTRLYEFMEIKGTGQRKEQETEKIVRRSPRKNRPFFEHSLISEDAQQNSSPLSIPQAVNKPRAAEQEKEMIVRRSPRKNRPFFEHSLISEDAQQSSIPQAVKTRSFETELRIVVTDIVKDMTKKAESESEEEADGRKEDKEQKKRLSGVGHKDTPVHKGFRSSRVKRNTVSRSVVTGKRLRRV